MTNGAHFRMLETDALNGVGELDVDAEVVGVELELVAVGEVSSSWTSIDSVATAPSIWSFQCRYSIR
jgi:hypothetical protein